MVENLMEKTDWIETVSEIIEKNQRDASALIAILQDTQRHLGYLPTDVLNYISDELVIPLSRVYSVATFYSAFKLKPTGKHIIKVCLGTACHIKGGPRLMNELEKVLKVKSGEATEDMMFSFEAVRCVGCCGLAPVVMIDENFHGKVQPKDIKKIVAKYRE